MLCNCTAAFRSVCQIKAARIMIDSYILMGCNNCVELSHAWTISENLNGSILVDSITKIMYTSI